MTVARQAPPSLEFSRQAYLSGLPFPSPRDLPNPGNEPALQADSLPLESPGEVFLNICIIKCTVCISHDVELIKELAVCQEALVMFNSVQPHGLYSQPGSSIHGILQPEYTSGNHSLLQGIFCIPGLSSHLLHLLHWQSGSLPLAPPGLVWPLFERFVKMPTSW